jgi:signal peptide peptidase SppA
MATRVRALWRRLPLLVRRVTVVTALYQTATYVQTSDVLYKIFSPAAHTLGGTVLDLDLTTVSLVPSDSARSQSPLAAASQLSVLSVAHAVRAAKDDPRVAGLLVRGLAGLGGLGLAEMTDLRRAVGEFAEGPAGKPAILHVPEGLGGGGNGTVPLWFSSAFSSVHVQPTSSVTIPGLSFASVFFKSTLEKLGVTPVKVARKEYKTAANLFTESGYTPPHRESTASLLDAIHSVVIDGIATGRGLTADAVNAALDLAIMPASHATTLGLIDAPAYRDELPALMRSALAVRVAAHRVARVAADAEWRAAMADLVAAAASPAAEKLNRGWNDGRAIGKAGDIRVAAFAAVAFADPVHGLVDAELRALKAHLAWIDSCPWQAIPRDAQDDYTLYTVGNAASVVELERKLCIDSIKALTKFQGDVPEMLKNSDGKKTLSLAESKKLLRWVGSIWRSKAFTSRMVRSLEQEAKLTAVVDIVTSNAEEADSGTLALGARDVAKAAEAALDTRPPRFFLLHEINNNHVPLIPAKDDDAPFASGVDYISEKKSRGTDGLVQWKDPLRYLTFSDYLEQGAQESRAANRRLNSGLLGRSSSLPSKVQGMKQGEFVGGICDPQEQFALLQLADSHIPFLQPWRMLVPRRAPTVAVIHINGAIADVGAEELRGAIRRAEKDTNVSAIVLRVDSPGGSASASDLIARAAEICTKPIVASMGNVCASGGYFISAPCDYIFAEDATITGSIGVIFSTFRPEGLFETLGVTVDEVSSNRLSKYFGIGGQLEEWPAELAERIDQYIDDFYKSFVSIVARGRGIGFDDAEKLARGRVWSGKDALKLGLVDRIGGLEAAIDYAAELAGGEPGAPARAVTYPSPSMQITSRLQRMGVLPKNLDEEGDESWRQQQKRHRRSRFGFLFSRDGDGGEDDPDSGTDDEGKDGSDEESKSDGDNEASKDDTGLAALIGSGKTRGIDVSSIETCSDASGTCDEYFRGNGVITPFVLSLLDALDDYMIGNPTPSRSVSLAVDFLVRSLPGGSNCVRSVIAAEVEMLQVTNGKAAAVMSPNLHIGDVKNA